MEQFAGLIGQEHAKRVLGMGLENGALPQVLVFAGPKGVGKKTAAKLLANLLHENSSDTHPDTFWFGQVLNDKRERNVTAPLKASTDELIRFLSLSPLVSKYKVAIVDEAQELSEESQAALLKTLEEPRADSVIILTLEDENKLLPTILSRVQVVRFVELTIPQIREGVAGVSDEILLLAEGSLGRAKELNKNTESLEDAKTLREFWLGVEKIPLAEKFKWSEQMRERETAERFLAEGLRALRPGLQGREGTREQLEAIETTLRKVQDNANVRMALDCLMLVL